MRKVLAVCGDSYMAAVAPDEYGAESHFTEILAQKLDWDYMTFARGGCSNHTIRLQIDEAIKINPNLVIIGTTSPDRIEFPIFPIDRNQENFWEGVYKKQNGLSNISYSSQDLSYYLFEHFKSTDPTLDSQTLSFVIRHKDEFLNGLRYMTRNMYPEEELASIPDILEKYFLKCYDMNWKRQIDTWIIFSGLQRLRTKNIPFYILPHFLYQEDLEEFSNNLINIHDTSLDPWNHRSTGKLARFHTDLESQKTLAENWYNFLQGKISEK